MPYAKKIVLHCPAGYHEHLDSMVEEFMKDGVAFVAVVGLDCEKVHDIIDEIVVGDGARDPEYHLLTSWHENATVEEVIQFARSLSLEFEGQDVQVVEL